MTTDYLKKMAQGGNVTNIASASDAGAKSISSVDHAVRLLNKTYHPVVMGKDFLIAEDKGNQYDFISTKTLEYIFKGDDKVSVQSGRGVKEFTKAEVWLNSANRNQVKRVDFLPNAAPDDNVLNLWRGFGVEPLSCSFLAAARRCRKFIRHIRQNICKGNRVEFRYFMRWCADLFQRPQIKSGVAVSIFGAKGTGKSKVAEALAALLGAHSVTVSQSSHLTGNFNSHLAQTLLVTAEEAVWAGDKHSEGTLKHMITSEDIMIEKKGIDAIRVQSLARILFIGNNQWIFPATEDERRLFALECGDKRMRDYAYFEAIDFELYGSVDGKAGNPAWKECDGIRSLLAFFLLVDISDFNIRDIPETVGLNNQRDMTLGPVAKYFQECLNEKRLGSKPDPVFEDRYIEEEWHDGEHAVISNSIYMGYLKFNERHFRMKPVTARQFWADAKKAFGESWEITKTAGNQNAKKVPGWKEARVAFMQHTRVSIDDRPDF